MVHVTTLSLNFEFGCVFCVKRLKWQVAHDYLESISALNFEKFFEGLILLSSRGHTHVATLHEPCSLAQLTLFGLGRKNKIKNKIK